MFKDGANEFEKIFYFSFLSNTNTRHFVQFFIWNFLLAIIPMFGQIKTLLGYASKRNFPLCFTDETVPEYC